MENSTDQGPPKTHRRLVAAPAVSPIESLLGKLDAWLGQQPEWFIILNAPRQLRRRAMRAMSHHLLTFPIRRFVASLGTTQDDDAA